MDKLDPFLNLGENLGDLDLNSKAKEFFELIEDTQKKDDANECTIIKCPECEGLLVQIPEKLPLEVRCMNCKEVFLLKNLITL